VGARQQTGALERGDRDAIPNGAVRERARPARSDGHLSDSLHHLIRCTANGDPRSQKEVAIAVLSEDGLRIPAKGERGQWDATHRWWTWARDVVQAIAVRRVGRILVYFTADADRLVAPAEYQRRILDVRSTTPLTAPRALQLPFFAIDPWWIVRHGAAGGQPLRVGGSIGASVTLYPGETGIVITDGRDFFGGRLT
jgi:hypothetical protein